MLAINNSKIKGKTVPYRTASQKIKYFRMNFLKVYYLNSKNYKPSLKEIKGDRNKWKATSCSRI